MQCVKHGIQNTELDLTQIKMISNLKLKENDIVEN